MIDFELIASQISTLFAPLGYPLELLAQHTGQRWGIVPDPTLFWFRPAGFHVFESLVIFPFLYFLWRRYGVSCVHRLLGNPQQRRVTRDSGGDAYFSASKPALMMDYFLGTILAVCWLAQVFFKASRPNPLVQLFWMCVPCHLITVAWAYALLSPPSWRNYQTCRFLAALLSMSSWGGVMASLFPDWSDHQYRIEGFMFYLHHGALLVMPHYWAAKHGMIRLRADLFWTYIVVALGINFFVYTPLSYVSGVNINYNLYPHLGMKHRTQWYRFLVPAVLAVWGIVYWYFDVFLNKMYFLMIVSAQGGTAAGLGRGNSYEVLSPCPASRSYSPQPSQSFSGSRINSSSVSSSLPVFNNTKSNGKKRTASNNSNSGNKNKKKK